MTKDKRIEEASENLALQMQCLEDEGFPGDIQKERKRLAYNALNEYAQQQVQEAVKKMFNLDETEKDWQEHFYESDWTSDTLTKTKLEEDLEEELGYFLPRHMSVYDWNLPYIDFITLVVRKHIKKALTQPQDGEVVDK